MILCEFQWSESGFGGGGGGGSCHLICEGEKRKGKQQYRCTLERHVYKESSLYR